MGKLNKYERWRVYQFLNRYNIEAVYHIEVLPWFDRERKEEVFRCCIRDEHSICIETIDFTEEEMDKLCTSSLKDLQTKFYLKIKEHINENNLPCSYQIRSDYNLAHDYFIKYRNLLVKGRNQREYRFSEMMDIYFYVELFCFERQIHINIENKSDGSFKEYIMRDTDFVQLNYKNWLHEKFVENVSVLFKNVIKKVDEYTKDILNKSISDEDYFLKLSYITSDMHIVTFSTKSRYTNNYTGATKVISYAEFNQMEFNDIKKLFERLVQFSKESVI